MSEFDTSSSTNATYTELINNPDRGANPLLSELVELILTNYNQFHNSHPNTPFVIGMTGGVSVGKSTLAKQIKSQLQSVKTVEMSVIVISSDGFLKSNHQLTQEQLSHRKGFPDSYDILRIEQFLSELRIPNQVTEEIPEYDHLIYDVKPHLVTINIPQIILFEGVNVLQFASNLDYTIYVDAIESNMRSWFLNRVVELRQQSFRDESAVFYRQFMAMSDEEFHQFAIMVWETVNLKNLEEYIVPYREMADVVVVKDEHHGIQSIAKNAK